MELVNNYSPKVGDYVVGIKQYGSRHTYPSGVEVVVPLFKKVYGTVTEIGGLLYIQAKRNIFLLENFKEVRIAVKKEREDRWVREKLLESTFSLIEGLPFDLKLAKKFNIRFCRDFKLVRSKIKIVDKMKGKLLGYHQYGTTWKHGNIRIRKSLIDKQKWETFFHELAHYREHNHKQSFHEEMEMIYKRFEKWCNQKQMLIAADKEKS